MAAQLLLIALPLCLALDPAGPGHTGELYDILWKNSHTAEGDAKTRPRSMAGLLNLAATGGGETEEEAVEMSEWEKDVSKQLSEMSVERSTKKYEAAKKKELDVYNSKSQKALKQYADKFGKAWTTLYEVYNPPPEKLKGLTSAKQLVNGVLGSFEGSDGSLRAEWDKDIQLFKGKLDSAMAITFATRRAMAEGQADLTSYISKSNAHEIDMRDQIRRSEARAVDDGTEKGTQEFLDAQKSSTGAMKGVTITRKTTEANRRQAIRAKDTQTAMTAKVKAKWEKMVAEMNSALENSKTDQNNMHDAATKSANDLKEEQQKLDTAKRDVATTKDSVADREEQIKKTKTSIRDIEVRTAGHKADGVREAARAVTKKTELQAKTEKAAKDKDNTDAQIAKVKDEIDKTDAVIRESEQRLPAVAQATEAETNQFLAQDAKMKEVLEKLTQDKNDVQAEAVDATAHTEDMKVAAKKSLGEKGSHEQQAVEYKNTAMKHQLAIDRATEERKSKEQTAAKYITKYASDSAKAEKFKKDDSAHVAAIDKLEPLKEQLVTQLKQKVKETNVEEEQKALAAARKKSGAALAAAKRSLAL